MSEKIELKHVGKIMDAHGIRGDVYGLVFSGDVTWIGKVTQLHFKKSQTIESFKIKRIKEFKKGFIASLESFDNRNKAEEYKGSEIWAEASLFVSKNGEALYLNEILGFEITDEILGGIGKISEFSSNGSQDLLIVESEDVSYEIPFVKDFVVKIDFENKTMTTKLPEGLLEINNEDASEPDDKDDDEN